MKTPKTITKIIVSILEFKAQHYTHNIGTFVESTSLQTNYKQIKNFASNRNYNRKTFSIAHYLSFFTKPIKWDPHDVNHNLLLL